MNGNKENQQQDELHWPSLKEAHGEEQQHEFEKSWEMLDPDKQDEEPKDRRAMLLRRNSFSTPDLRQFVIVEEKEDEGNSTAGFSLVKDDEVSTLASDFSLVSTPANTRTPHASFLDALKQKGNDESSANGNHRKPADATPTRITPRRPRIKPKFVVVTPPANKMKRCAKSTGDLTKLTTLAEEDYHGNSSAQHHGDDDDDDVLGETDAMDYYHRKAKGSIGRRNGLKERPDEAKRKEISVYKRDMQRAAQQQQQQQQQAKPSKT